MKTLCYPLSLFILFIFACSPVKKEADIIFINAKVYTVSDRFDIAESFAVKDGKFLSVGLQRDILKHYTSSRIIDLDGKYVYPGFYDAHCHFYGYGLTLLKVDLTGTKSYDEILAKVKAFANKNQSEWILGRGWDQNDWEEKDFPTNEMLNEAFPDKPVVLTRVDGHAALVNDAALKRAGISTNTKIDGGKFVVKDGKLTGILIDNAVNLIQAVIPVSDVNTEISALMKAQLNCFEVGLTTVSDAGLAFQTVKLIDSLQNCDSLKIRVYAMLEPTDENLVTFVAKGPYKTNRLNVRCIKVYADGALGSRGAALLTDYSDDKGNNGLILTPKPEMEKLCIRAFQNNYQVATHAIGDSANRLVLKLYGEILKSGNDKRWRIEHSQVIAPEDFNLFKAYNITPSVQPTHATSDMYWADKRLGAERLKNAYAYKTLLQANGWLALGSDFPVEDINPLFGFYSAVSRKDQAGFPKNGFNMDEALSREEALRGMTIWAARANFEEKERGSIEANKLADFVVLEEDIMTIDLGEVYKVKVLQTHINGERVF